MAFARKGLCVHEISMFNIIEQEFLMNEEFGDVHALPSLNNNVRLRIVNGLF